MGTTTDRAAVVERSTDLTPVADSITRTLLDARAMLPHEANGRPLAPSNPRAAQIAKEMASGRSHEAFRLMTLVDTNLEDGVPLQIATAGIQRMLTYFDVRAAAIRRRPVRSIESAFDVETRQQHRTDLVSHRAIRSTACEQTLTDAIRETHRHIAALSEFARSCEAELASRHSSRAYALRTLRVTAR